MNIQGIEIKGRSVSGYATAVTLPEFDLCFDLGMATHDAVQCQNVAITHGHLDHFGGLARHGYIRGMTKMAVPNYIVPPWLVGPTRQTFEFWGDVQRARRAPHNVITAEPHEDIPIGPLKGKRFLRAFPTIHRVPSQGYTLIEKRKRLKPEFEGIEGRELGRLKREGVLIEDEVEFPLFALTGDTEVRVLDSMPYEAMNAKVLAFECTFLGDDMTEKEAARRGHTHIAQLARRANQFHSVGAVLLYHFSQRYSNKDIEAAIADLPASLRAKTTYLPVAK